MAAFVRMQYLMGRITARQVWEMAKKGVITNAEALAIAGPEATDD